MRLPQWHFSPYLMRLKQLGKQGLNRIQQRPIGSFLLLLFLLLAVIAIGNLLRKPKLAAEPPLKPKTVETYRIGSAPRVEVQAKVEKTGVIKLTALTGGIVQKITVAEGEQVGKGKMIVSLASNYSGGNAASIQRQLAATQYQNVINNYDAQKALIQSQKQMAELQGAQAEELRKVSDQSMSNTIALRDLNQSILNQITTNLQNASGGNANAVGPAVVALQQQQAQYQSVVNQLNTTIGTQMVTAREGMVGEQINQLTPRIAVKQLELQERALELSKATAGLQLQLAQIQESLMYPSSPVNGVVQRVYVQEGQAVQPGTLLAEITGNIQDPIVRALVPKQVAQSISQIENSRVLFNGKAVETKPAYVSTEATDGQLYSVTFAIPDEYNDELTNSSFVTVSIPVGYANTGSVLPFVPLDAIYQTQDKAYVFIAVDGKVQARDIRLGDVSGGYVLIKQGLSDTDSVILNRDIVAGDPVKERE